MIEGKELEEEVEKAILVCAILGKKRSEAEEHLAELELLAHTAKISCMAQVTQEREKIDPATYLGSGKIEEIAVLADQLEAELLLFDDELSPSQGRNIEKITKKRVQDRTGLILDIFAKRAHTREAKLQVELARVEYLLPRLTGMWSHFTRQKGGVGLKGDGETQLEMDRRMTKTRISELKKEIEKLGDQREIRRRSREKYFRVSLVGYTNAGKSTLLNALTDAGTYTEDQLFATLDSTTRRIPRSEVLLADTVGFIRKLPHTLVASFRSTLSEIKEADLLLHVVDVSHPTFLDQMAITDTVLNEIGAGDIPAILVLNKSDRLPDCIVGKLQRRFPEGVFLSAKEKKGTKELVEKIREMAELPIETAKIPFGSEKQLADFYKLGRVLDVRYGEEFIEVDFRRLRSKSSKA